jgi:hypothetical protein
MVSPGISISMRLRSGDRYTVICCTGRASRSCTSRTSLSSGAPTSVCSQAARTGSATWAVISCTTRPNFTPCAAFGTLYRTARRLFEGSVYF